ALAGNVGKPKRTGAASASGRYPGPAVPMALGWLLSCTRLNAAPESTASGTAAVNDELLRTGAAETSTSKVGGGPSAAPAGVAGTGATAAGPCRDGPGTHRCGMGGPAGTRGQHRSGRCAPGSRLTARVGPRRAALRGRPVAPP